MQLRRVLWGSATIALAVAAAHQAHAGSVDDRFPFLAPAKAAPAQEPNLEVAGPSVSRQTVPTVAVAARRQRSPIPFPRPVPKRGGSLAASDAGTPHAAPGGRPVAYAAASAGAMPGSDAAAPMLTGRAEIPPAQMVAARMAPLEELAGAGNAEALYATAARTATAREAPEAAGAGARTASADVGGPFVPPPKPPGPRKLALGDIVVLVENTAVAHGVPLELAHAVVRVESNYNPAVTGRGGTLGLMQIKYATARGIGYGGSAQGLLDPAVNLEWGMRYLAGARKLAKGSVCGTVLRYQAGHRAARMTAAAAKYCGRVRGIMAAIR